MREEAHPVTGRWLTIDELAEVMNRKRSWVRDMVTARRLPHRRVGGVRFAPEDVAAIKEMFFEPAVVDPSRTTVRRRRAAA